MIMLHKVLTFYCNNQFAFHIIILTHTHSLNKIIFRSVKIIFRIARK